MKRRAMKYTDLALLLATAVATSACMADVPESLPGPDDVPPKTSEAAGTNARRTAFNFFVAKGLTQIQAAGIVGNLMQESSVIPTAVEYGGGPGRGIAQWSVGGRWDTSRGDNITAYASQHGESRWALQTQLDFIWFELDSVGGYGLSTLRSASTISAATVAFERDFEACGTCSQTARINFAQQAYNDFAVAGGTSGGGTSGGATGSGGGSSSGGAGLGSAFCQQNPGAC
jgi:hypothetical protein